MGNNDFENNEAEEEMTVELETNANNCIVRIIVYANDESVANTISETLQTCIS